MLKVCASCNSEVCETEFVLCIKCANLELDTKQNPRKECLSSHEGCNFEPMEKGK